MTSNDALQKARRLYNAAKAGHTGTLDPLATGLLPLCFGEATKFSAELLDADKTYLATVRLGIVTDTADAEGTVTATRPVTVSDDELSAVLSQFVGQIEQIPPMHSALKRDGKPLYAYARAGIEVERSPRRITIHALHLLKRDGDAFDIEVTCSKGTYVRTLAADIGERLGCGAHLAALRRIRIGRLDIADAVTLDALAELDETSKDARLYPADSLLSNLAKANLNTLEAGRIAHGQGIRWTGETGERFRLFAADGRFLGVGEVSADGWLNPKRLITELQEKSPPNS
jgi:tRNA pseudouridine55 synthase